MSRPFFASIAAMAMLATPAAAQDEPTRYDRALAAGYKALFLCSAIESSKLAGKERSMQSIIDWELTGVQAPLDGIIRDMPVTIDRGDEEYPDALSYGVTWADDMPPRFAFRWGDGGCSVAPIGMSEERVRRLSGGFGRMPKWGAKVPLPADSKRIGARAKQVLSLNAFNDAYGKETRSTGFVILEKGKIVHEHYADDFGPHVPQRTWSVAKSIAATLVGTAVLAGEATVEDPIQVNYWRSTSDLRRTMTLDNMLRMASGRYSDTPGNRTDPIYWGGSTVDERAASWPLVHTPGTKFRYANNDTLMAVKAIEGYLEYYKPQELFAKLGMRNTTAETDWRGSYVLSSQVWSSPHDLARLGQLYVNNGMWNGERLLPENWRDYVSSPSGPQPEGRPIGYGAGFWLFNNTPGIPADTFAAMGNRGQYIVIIPSKEIVIVRRGEDPAGHRFDIAGFTQEVLSALEG